jgi:glycosyltransferase 2 family protein
MMISGGASVFQLPVIGWFTQIFAVAAVLAKIFEVDPEASVACAAVLLLVTFLCVIPIGLVWAQFENISLRKVTHESEVAEHVVEPTPDPNPESL